MPVLILYERNDGIFKPHLWPNLWKSEKRKNGKINKFRTVISI